MVGLVAMKFSVVVGGMVRNIKPWNRPGLSRLGQEKAGNFNFSGFYYVKWSLLGCFLTLRHEGGLVHSSVEPQKG